MRMEKGNNFVGFELKEIVNLLEEYYYWRRRRLKSLKDFTHSGRALTFLEQKKLM